MHPHCVLNRKSNKQKMNTLKFLTLTALASISLCSPTLAQDTASADTSLAKPATSAAKKFVRVFANESDNKPEDPDIAAVFDYINKVRHRPKDFAKEIGTKQLKKVHARAPFRWNENIASAAQYFAEQMAECDSAIIVDKNGLGINYTINNHGYRIAPALLQNSAACSLGCAAWGYNFPGIAAAQFIMYDGGVKNKNKEAGGRALMLGMGPLYAACRDFGIGHAVSASGKHYWCFFVGRKYNGSKWAKVDFKRHYHKIYTKRGKARIRK